MNSYLPPKAMWKVDGSPSGSGSRRPVNLQSGRVAAFVACCALTAPAAMAQTPQSPLPAAPAAVALPSGSGSTAFDDIVVTARRREEGIQSVPAAITAITEQELQAKQVNVTTSEWLTQGDGPD